MYDFPVPLLPRSIDFIALFISGTWSLPLDADGHNAAACKQIEQIRLHLLLSNSHEIKSADPL